MLQAIRDRITGLVAIFVLGLLAVPFLFFGLESYIRAVPQDAVATVGDDEISSSEFQTSFARYRANLRQSQGEAYDEIATNQPIVRREHLEGMIDQLLLRQHARQLGMDITDAALVRILSDIPQFQIDGRFDAELYRDLLRATGRTPRGFERELRDDMLVSLLPTALTDSVLITEAEIDRLIALQSETRAVSFIEIPQADFLDQIEVTEDDVAAFYADNQANFMTTEQVRIAYVELAASDLTEGLELSEEELRQRYEAASQRYMTPETRRASHILLEIGAERSREQAMALGLELRERLLAGEDFAELATSLSDDPASASIGGDLGWIEPGVMVEPFEDALYALAEPGDISEPVESRFGLHVIRLDEIRAPTGMSFEEARDEILAEHIERESETLFIELSDRVVDLVFADDSSLEPLAAELGLQIRESEPFSRAGGVGIAANRRVAEAAFSDTVLIERILSDPIEIDRNHVVVIKLLEHFPSVPQPLEEVADRILSRLQQDRAADLARDRARQLLADIRDAGGSMEAVAEAAELNVEVREAVGRFDFQLGGDFVQALFRLPAPGDEPSLYVLPKGRSVAVVRLEAVQPGNPATASDPERFSARQQLQFAQMGQDVQGLIEYLRANTRIRVVEERL